MRPWFKLAFVFPIVITTLGLHLPLEAQGQGKTSSPSSKQILKMLHKLDKSLVVTNDSTRDWYLCLLSPAPDQAATPGVLEVHVPDFKAGALTQRTEMRVDHDVLIPPGKTLVFSPVPSKSVGASLGISRRPDFKRVIALKDSTKKALLMGLYRNGSGDKVPQLIFSDKNLEQRANGRIFTLEQDEGGQAQFFTIIKNEIGAI